MRIPRVFVRRRSIVILLLLLIAAFALSAASYQYSSQISANVASLSLDQIHSNTQIEASDLSHVLQKNLDGVSANLDILANTVAVSSENTSAAAQAFNSAQNATRSLTAAYFLTDQTGRIILLSNGSTTTYPPGSGFDMSERQTFTYPKANGATFFSSATPSVSNSSKDYLFISRPVYWKNNGSFAGVAASAIYLGTLGDSLEHDLSPSFQSSLGLLDSRGTILYSGNKSSIGENVFSAAYQSTLPSGLKQQFDTFLNQSLSGNSGFQDISYLGASGTLAYQPVFVNATTGNGGQVPVEFGVLYVVATDTLASSAAALIGQERFVSLGLIVGIAVVSAGCAVAILRWNRNLDRAVREKTSDLLIANSELDAKAKAEKDLMNITAHELRTPTQSILANTEILRRVIRPVVGLPQNLALDYPGQLESLGLDLTPQEIVDLVDSSYRNSQRLQRLTQSILEVARIDNKTLRLETEKFDLNELAKQCIEDTRALMKGEDWNYPKVNIELKQNQAALYVVADKTKISEVLSNLLDNAIRFSKEGDRVLVSTDQKKKKDGGGDLAIIRVTDQGPGVDREILPKLFTKFATKTGTGLGLYISKAYVEAHGGKLNYSDVVDDQNRECGASFEFTLPLDSQVRKPELQRLQAVIA